MSITKEEIVHSLICSTFWIILTIVIVFMLQKLMTIELFLLTGIFLGWNIKQLWADCLCLIYFILKNKKRN